MYGRVSILQGLGDVGLVICKVKVPVLHCESCNLPLQSGPTGTLAMCANGLSIRGGEGGLAAQQIACVGGLRLQDWAGLGFCLYLQTSMNRINY